VGTGSVGPGSGPGRESEAEGVVHHRPRARLHGRAAPGATAAVAAGKPVELTDAQLDRVTAGAHKVAFDRSGKSFAVAFAKGDFVYANADVTESSGGTKATATASSISR
jgi:hypothetical protein